MSGLYSKITGVSFMGEAHSRALRDEIATEIMHVARRLMQRTSHAMERQGVGMGQIPILKLLDENGTMTQRQLAEEIRVTPATICGTLKRMERAGLVRRTQAREDARVSCVSLTEEGKACVRKVEAIIEQRYDDMMAGFSEEECRLMCNFARRMGENLMRSMGHAEEEQTDADR